MCAGCGHVIRNYLDVGTIAQFNWGAVLYCRDCTRNPGYAT